MNIWVDHTPFEACSSVSWCLNWWTQNAERGFCCSYNRLVFLTTSEKSQLWGSRSVRPVMKPASPVYTESPASKCFFILGFQQRVELLYNPKILLHILVYYIILTKQIVFLFRHRHQYLNKNLWNVLVSLHDNSWLSKYERSKEMKVLTEQDETVSKLDQLSLVKGLNDSFS